MILSPVGSTPILYASELATEIGSKLARVTMSARFNLLGHQRALTVPSENMFDGRVSCSNGILEFDDNLFVVRTSGFNNQSEQVESEKK